MTKSDARQIPEEPLSSPVLEYASRDGVKRSTEEAAQFLLNAAGQGDAEAQYRLGWMLQMGRETLQSLGFATLIEIPLPEEWEKAQQSLYREALEWFTKAATQGHSHAQKNIALIHSGGLGVPQDSSAGLRWLRKAVEADSTNSDAQFFMGQAYLKGWGVESNAVEAAR
ncbi:MAG: sel1 repeat family protein [Deltaproteobacteria bacterium]|nr:sel1 repeat family protein [Deltaproteobacteria bacterium]